MRRVTTLIALLAAGPAFSNGSDFDLIYDPTDGTLWFDTNGGRIVHYVMEGGPFLYENHQSPLLPAVTGRQSSAEIQLGGTNFGASFIPNPVSIGQVLPAGLDETQFLDRVSEFARYNSQFGHGADFELSYDWPEQRQPAFTGGASSGTTQFRISAQGLFDAEGNVLASSSKTMAVIDVDGDGIDGFNFDSWIGDSFLPDPDDVLVSDSQLGLWYEATGDGDFFEDRAPESIQNSVIDSTRDPWYEVDTVNAANNTDAIAGEGDRVYLFYFPDLPIDAQSPGMLQPFGVFEAGSLSGPNEFSFLYTVGEDTVYLANNSTGEGTLAQFITVPEPASMILVAMPLLTVIRRRRRA